MYIQKMHDLPLYLLETLSAFFEERNVVKTARRLKTTQPTVTRQLLLLQNYFHKPLFKMQGREKRFTDFGLAMATEAHKALQDMKKRFESVSRQYGQAEQMTIRLGGRREFIQKYISAKHFKTNMEIHYLSSEAVISGLLKDEIDVGITHQPLNNAGFIRKQLFLETPTLAVPKSFALEKPTVKIWAGQSIHYPVAAHASMLESFKAFQRLCGITGAYRYNFTVADWEMIERRVEAQTAWAILPKIFTLKSKNYHVLDLSDQVEGVAFYVYYRKDLRKFEWFQEFLELILD
jgi:DNA-binding transcriptional LysR family regulator